MRDAKDSICGLNSTRKTMPAEAVRLWELPILSFTKQDFVFDRKL